LIAELIRLPNQTGTLLLMLPTWWALVLASEGRPDPILIFIFFLGSFLMRSAGVIVNDLADRRLDRQVDRTKTRPLASGALSLTEASLTLVVLLAMVTGLLVFLNRLAFLLSPIAFLLAAVYPYSKRIMTLPQAVLGLAFGWGVIMAWAAVRNTLEMPVWLLYGGTICWVVAYDTIYALQDLKDDLRVGIKSSAILFGPWTWLAVAVGLILMLACVGLAGWLAGLGLAFYAVLAAVGGFLSRQVVRLRGQVPPPQALSMFKQHVWVGWAILGGIWAGFL
jgi:4-hydroxybenzoate polyprenyltransferase